MGYLQEAENNYLHKVCKTQSTIYEVVKQHHETKFK